MSRATEFVRRGDGGSVGPWARVAACLRQRAAARDERGQTLLEVILVAAIASVLALPTLAWVVTGVKVGNRVEQVSSAIRGQNMLTAYLERDVARAVGATVGRGDCAGGASAGGNVVVALPAGANEPTVVYSIVESGRSATMWRRSCNVDGSVTELAVVNDLIRPAAGWSSVLSCPMHPVGGDDCGRQIEMSVQVAGRELVTVAAVRRIGAW